MTAHHLHLHITSVRAKGVHTCASSSLGCTYIHTCTPSSPSCQAYLHTCTQKGGRRLMTRHPNASPPLVTAAPTHWKQVEVGPKCPAHTPACTFLEVCRSGQKLPAYTPCSTGPQPARSGMLTHPGGPCQLRKTCQAGPPKCPAYTPYLTVSSYCHNSDKLSITFKPDIVHHLYGRCAPMQISLLRCKYSCTPATAPWHSSRKGLPPICKTSCSSSFGTWPAACSCQPHQAAAWLTGQLQYSNVETHWPACRHMVHSM